MTIFPDYIHTSFTLSCLVLIVVAMSLPFYCGAQAQSRRITLRKTLDAWAPRLGLPSGRALGLWAILFLLCISTLWLFLGSTLFNTRGEPREALVSMAMVDTGNWVLPVTNGVDLAYKPPFFHWCGAVVASVFGGVTEFSARFPSAIALTLIVLAIFRFYATRRGTSVALLTALITLTNFELHRAGVAARVDMVLTASMVLALLALFRWCERGMRGIPLWPILAMSVAFLTKGPVGVVLPCAVAGLYAWWRVRGLSGVIWRMLSVALASCILPLAWYWAAYEQGGEAFWQLVYEENVLRFLGKMTYASHINPWHYNVMTLLAGFAPYTLLVVVSAFVLPWKRWYISAKAPITSWWQAIRTYFVTMDATRLYTLLCFVVMFVFYCIPKSKRSTYLMPLYPFVAYYLAEYILYLWREHRRVVVWFGGFIAVLCFVLPLSYALVWFGVFQPAWFGQRSMAMNTFMFDALRDFPLTLDRILLLLLPFLIVILWYKTRHKHWVFIPMMIASIFMALEGFYQPAILGAKSSYGFVQHIKQIAPNDTIYYYDNDYAEGNRMHPFTANFYLKGRIVPFIEFGQTLPMGYILIAEDDTTDFATAYPHIALTPHLRADRPSPDDHAMYSLYLFTPKR